MWITVGQYQARHRDSQGQDARIAVATFTVRWTLGEQDAQDPIPDARGPKLEFVEGIAFEEHEVRRPEIAWDVPPMDVRETYPAQRAPADTQLGSQA